MYYINVGSWDTTWQAWKANGRVQLLSLHTWPFPIKLAGDHLRSSGGQGHGVPGSLQGADLHLWDEGEGHTGHSGSALLLALVRVVDHQDFQMGCLSVLVCPFLASVYAVGDAGACISKCKKVTRVSSYLLPHRYDRGFRHCSYMRFRQLHIQHHPTHPFYERRTLTL